MKKALEVERRNRQEINSLREFIFSLDQQEEYKPASEDVSLEELKDYKAVVLGGHERWQAKMKELLPGFIFIHPDNKSFDLRILDGINTVFVYVNYLNHAIYERMMEAIQGTDIKIIYLNQQNEDIVLKQMYKAVKEKL